MKAIVNSPLHPILGERFAVITFSGRKTGKTYSIPINVTPVEGVLTTISLRGRTWWRNLRGGQPASLRRNGSRLEVRTETVEAPEEVTAGLAAFLRLFPGDAKYFNIRCSPDGEAEPEELEHAAVDHVLVRFHPA
jgi:hypothetical protein